MVDSVFAKRLPQGFQWQVLVNVSRQQESNFTSIALVAIFFLIVVISTFLKDAQSWFVQ